MLLPVSLALLNLLWSQPVIMQGWKFTVVRRHEPLSTGPEQVLPASGLEHVIIHHPPVHCVGNSGEQVIIDNMKLRRDMAGPDVEDPSNMG